MVAAPASYNFADVWEMAADALGDKEVLVIGDERRTYAVRATIEVDGVMWWTSADAHHVLTGDSPDHVEVMVTRVAR